jgi:spore germination cell wall hydrolase CwlJ-like protein
MIRYLVSILSIVSFGLLAGGSKPTHSYQERAVAAVLMGEAWGEGKVGMLAVGEVVQERCVRLKKSPYQIVTTGRNGVHAFSCLNGTQIDALIRKFADKPEYKTALDVAALICRAPEQLPGLTHGATHFAVATSKPSWAKGKTPVAIIGAHAFYRLRWI